VRPDESHLDGVSHKDQEIGEVSIHVQDPARFLMDGELAPRDGLHEFLQRTEASGEHDEGVGELGHAVFSLMHGADHVETGQAAVAIS
jgi:hypothetical protein